MDGRKEKRTTRTLRVLLSNGLQPVVAEYASIENISSYGVRVRTDRPRKPDSRLLIKSTLGESWASARVVYCQTLKSRMFALGLEFLSGTADWMLQPAWRRSSLGWSARCLQDEFRVPLRQARLPVSGPAAAMLANAPFSIKIFDTWNAMFRGVKHPTGW